MKVVEKFISINGEGPRAGELSVFIRFKGCNLNCTYCDTKWANDEDCGYEETPPRDILRYVLSSKVENVTLTGGEPLLQKDMPLLLNLLVQHPNIRTEIETNGSIDLAPFIKPERPAFTMDYKLPSSGCEHKMLLSNMALLSSEDTVKFVVGSAEDMEAACRVLEKYELRNRCHVYFSPAYGLIEPEDIVNYMIDRRLNGVRVQLQMHKYIWDPDRRGV